MPARTLQHGAEHHRCQGVNREHADLAHVIAINAAVGDASDKCEGDKWQARDHVALEVAPDKEHHAKKDHSEQEGWQHPHARHARLVRLNLRANRVELGPEGRCSKLDGREMLILFVEIIAVLLELLPLVFTVDDKVTDDFGYRSGCKPD